MRDSVLISSFFPKHVGGLQTHVDLLVQSLKHFDIPVTLELRDAPTLQTKAQAALRNPLMALTNPRLSLLKETLKQFSHVIEAKARTHQVVHCHDVFAASAMPLNSPAKMVLTVHGPASKEMEMAHPTNRALRDYVRSIEREGYKRASAIIAVDGGQKSILIEEYGVDPSKIHVVANAVDTDHFCPRSSFHEEPYLLCHRRLVKKNGVEIAIKALSLVTDKSLRLKIAGDGPELETLKTLSGSLGCSHKIDFLGPQSRTRILQLIQEATAVVVPSVPSHGVIEATSISALEAMSCGKVVLASNIGGLAELLEDRETGLLFPAGDFRALAFHIDEIRRSPELSRKISLEAREMTLRMYGASAWAERILGIYKSILDVASESKTSL